MSKFFSKISSLLISAVAISSSAAPVLAQKAVTWDKSACPDNPSSLSVVCTATPDRYEVTIYEMGLCDQNPLTGADFDREKCITTATSTSGVTVDLSGGATFELTEATQVRPPNGSYQYAYLVVGTEFGLKGSYELAGSTWASNGNISSGNGLVTENGTATNFQATLDEFNVDADSCASEFTANNIHGGNVYARLTNSELVTASQAGQGTGSCSGRTRAVAVFEPGSPIRINQFTSALQVQFVTTDTGLTVIPDSGDDEVVDSFAMGPLMTVFTVIN